MTGVEDRSGGGDGTSPNGEDSSVTLRSTIIPAADTAKHWMKNYRTSIASSTSSILAGGIVYPLDTIKINMQGGTHPTVKECIREMYRLNGIRVFWRSFTVPTVSVTMVRTTTFSIYQKAKYSYSAAIGKATGGEDPLVIVNKPGSTPTYATVGCFAAAGFTAGSLSVLMSCPFELVKIATQVSGISNKGSMDDPVRKSYQKKGSFKTAKNLVVQRGVLGLYSGFRIQLLRDSIGSTIYFATYESMKQLLVKFQGSNDPTSPLSVAISGGVCGMTAWICTYPIDTAKTKYQHKCLSKTKGQDVKRPEIDYFNLKQYRGLGVSLARTGLTNAIFFSAFEYLKRNINALPDTILDSVD